MSKVNYVYGNGNLMWGKIKELLKSRGYDVVIDRDKSRDTVNGFLTLVSNRQDVCEFYISAITKYATMQTLSSVCVHDARDISKWFF